MDEAGKRAILSAAGIIAFGLAVTLYQLDPDREDNKPTVPLFSPSATTMQTAKQEPAGKEEIFPSCEFKPMPCIDRVPGSADAFLFESVPGKPAKQTPVLVLSTVPGGYKIVRK